MQFLVLSADINATDTQRACASKEILEIHLLITYNKMQASKVHLKEYNFV